MLIFGTADDVFAMAVRIEENGQQFYSGAARQAEDPTVKGLFLDLAAMEEGHVTIFKNLRRLLPAGPDAGSVWDPEGLAESYLQAAADSHIFTVQEEIERLPAVKEPLAALEMALQFEKDSLAFFLGMKAILPDEGGRREIDTLVHAEMEHIIMLVTARNAFLASCPVAIN